MCVTPITVWVVSKNESNCLSENKMVSTLIWRHVSLLYVVQSNILWLTILLSYHYRYNVVFPNYRFPVSFLLYIATQKTEPNHYCKQFYEYSYHQKNNSCTLCVPMFQDGGIGTSTSFGGRSFIHCFVERVERLRKLMFIHGDRVKVL